MYLILRIQSIAHTGTTEIPLDIWYHIVGIYDGSAQTMDLYVNGVKDVATKTSDVPSAIQSTNSDVHIGNYQAVEHFNGSIDEVKIYNYARTQEQILIDYNAGLGTHIK